MSITQKVKDAKTWDQVLDALQEHPQGDVIVKEILLDAFKNTLAPKEVERRAGEEAAYATLEADEAEEARTQNPSLVPHHVEKCCKHAKRALNLLGADIVPQVVVSLVEAS